MPSTRCVRTTERAARIAWRSPAPLRTGKLPSLVKNHDAVRVPNTPSSAMNTIGRGLAATSSGMSHMLSWFAASTTGPDEGRCSAPRTVKWKYQRRTDSHRARAIPWSPPVAGWRLGSRLPLPLCAATVAAASAIVRSPLLSSSRTSKASSRARANSVRPRGLSSRGARGSSIRDPVTEAATVATRSATSSDPRCTERTVPPP